MVPSFIYPTGEGAKWWKLKFSKFQIFSTVIRFSQTELKFGSLILFREAHQRTAAVPSRSTPTMVLQTPTTNKILQPTTDTVRKNNNKSPTISAFVHLEISMPFCSTNAMQ